MKTSLSLLLLLSILFFSNCKKTASETPLPGLATVNTASVSAITHDNAICGGVVTSDGGAAVTARGVVWGTDSLPTIALPTKTVDGADTGSFTSHITGLTSGTRYFVRAYATNSYGTAYGTQSAFVTGTANLPIITTTNPSSITNDNAMSGGTILSEGSGSVIARGVVWSTDSLPTIALSTKTTDGTGGGTFVSSITGLSCGTTCYARAYATNAIGTAYGNQITFTPGPAGLQQLNLYTSHETDTLILDGGFIEDNPTNIHVNQSVISELTLPPGIYLYIRFDSVYRNISCGNGVTTRLMNMGDTMHFKSDPVSSVGIHPEVFIGGIGLEYHDSRARYSIWLKGRATTSSSDYHCKFVKRFDATNTFLWYNLRNDSTCNSTCPFR